VVVDLRADAAARKLLDVLPAHPVISVDTPAVQVGISPTAVHRTNDEIRTG